jgi:hypothetical protein
MPADPETDAQPRLLTSISRATSSTLEIVTARARCVIARMALSAIPPVSTLHDRVVSTLRDPGRQHVTAS